MFKHIADYKQWMKFHKSKENKVNKMTTQDTSLEQKLDNIKIREC